MKKTVALYVAALAFAPPLLSQYIQNAPGAVPLAGVEKLAYDWVRDRTVCVARVEGQPVMQTWEHDGFTWRQIATVNAPGRRYTYGLTFDGQRVLLYGGQDATKPGILGDFWAYDGNDWTQISTSAPPGARLSLTMAYDSARGKAVLYGGFESWSTGVGPTDTWEWDGTSWTRFNVPGPGSRVWHRMVFDEARQRVVLAGGAFNPSAFIDTWEWDGTTWIQTVNGGFPYPSADHALVYDGSTQRTLLISGFDIVAGGIRNQVWAYDPLAGNWNFVLSTPPLERDICAAYDSSRQRVLILNGNGDIIPQIPSIGYYYRDTGSQAATFQPFGMGCPGGNNQVPVLQTAPGSLPQRGSTFTVVVTNLGNSTAGVLAAGFSRSVWGGIRLPLSLAPFGLTGCDLLVSPDAVVPMTFTSGAAHASAMIPTQSTLEGAVFFEQALLIDPTAPNGIGAVSNGGMLVIQ